MPVSRRLFLSLEGEWGASPRYAVIAPFRETQAGLVAQFALCVPWLGPLHLVRLHTGQLSSTDNVLDWRVFLTEVANPRWTHVFESHRNQIADGVIEMSLSRKFKGPVCGAL